MELFRLLGILFFVASISLASPAPATEVSLEQLSKAIADMVQSDEAVENQPQKNTTALLEAQKAAKNLPKSSKAPGGVPSPPPVPLSADMQQFASHLISAIKEVGWTASSNDTQLMEILNELKEMNQNFKTHLALLSCPPPFIKLGDECFNVILEDVSWEEARSKCLRMGADLAAPNDINRLKVYVGERYHRKNMRNFWIGGKNEEKVWRWLSGERIEESLWHTNEPSGNGECLAMFDGWDNPLTDFPCENERRAICERTLYDESRGKTED